MKKVVSLLFFMVVMLGSRLFSQNPSECEQFYERSGYIDYEIDGKVISKEKKEDRIEIEIKNENGKMINLAFFSNKTSMKIFRSLHIGDVVRKNKGENRLRIGYFTQDKTTLNVRVYMDLCD